MTNFRPRNMGIFAAIMAAIGVTPAKKKGILHIDQPSRPQGKLPRESNRQPSRNFFRGGRQAFFARGGGRPTSPLDDGKVARLRKLQADVLIGEVLHASYRAAARRETQTAVNLAGLADRMHYANTVTPRTSGRGMTLRGHLTFPPRVVRALRRGASFLTPGDGGDFVRHGTVTGRIPSSVESGASLG